MSFSSLLKDTLTRHPQTGTDKWNKDTFGPDAGPIACRFDPQVGKVVKSLRGEDEVSDGKVFMGKAPVIDPKDEITIDGVRYRILMLQTQGDSTAAHHQKIIVKRQGP